MNEVESAKALHRRNINHQTWHLVDGGLEIESRLIDARANDTHTGFDRPLSAGEPVHDMTIRIQLGPDAVIRDIKLRMDSAPFETCPEVIGKFETLRGASMGKGWNDFLSVRFNGVGGCRHLVDLLRGMGTVVFQSSHGTGWSRESLESMADSCHAFRQDGPVMAYLRDKIEK
jgi:hypothetical protein